PGVHRVIRGRAAAVFRRRPLPAPSRSTDAGPGSGRGRCARRHVARVAGAGTLCRTSGCRVVLSGAAPVSRARLPGAHAPAGSVVGWQLAALLGLHVVLLGLMLTRRLDFLFNAAMHRNGPGTDFAAYYVAGGAWLRSESMYGPGPGFGFRYHPLFAMTVGAALSRLDFGRAYGVWVAVNEILLAVDLVIVRRLLPDPPRYLGIVALVVVFTPYYRELFMGNASIVAVSLLLIALFLDAQGWRSAVVPLVVASIVVKSVGLVFVPLLLLRD